MTDSSPVETSSANSESNAPPTRKRRLPGRWKVGLIVIAAALALEGTARVHQYAKMGPLPTYLPRHLVDFYRFYRVNPAYRSPTVRVNSAGFRNDEEITPDKPCTLFRVVMMGGSTVWGEDAPGPLGTIDNRDTIAAHLEAILTERSGARGSNLRVQVINAGVVGYMLFQEETYFSTYIADYKPDLVITMDGHNDLDALQFGLPPYRHRNDAPFDRELNRPLALDLWREFLRYTETKSLFVRKTSSRITGWINQLALAAWQTQYDHPPQEQQIQRWLDAYSSTVRRLDASARIANAPILFTVQLEVAGESQKPLTSAEAEMRDRTYAHYRWLHTTMRDRLIARMRELQTQHSIWFEDVSDAFRSEHEQAYIDYTHLSRFGAAAMARRLASVVEPVLSRGPQCHDR
jgi:lysophospholipase L1-like esterase